ncbi:peroxisomal 2,4-dienoyl-CoA reductase Sps19p [(3E)-enoyl-CoA-producing] [Diutina catenulata]
MPLGNHWSTESVWKPDLFKGKVVFVTGGGGTICKDQAEAMIALGADAAIIGRNESKTVAAAEQLSRVRPGARVVACPNTDVRSVQSLKAAADKTVAELGRIDYVIAGAAGNFLADFNHLSSNAFKSVVDIDLLGSYNTVKACFDELRKNKGSVIFVSATLHYYGVPFQLHVGAAKAGVDALSNALAVELGPLGIRVNALAPGPIGGTEGYKRLAVNPEGVAQTIPAQRLGTTGDIANATVFLFSEAASYITGTVQVVDGGNWHMGYRKGQYPVKLLELNSQKVTKL